MKIGKPILVVWNDGTVREYKSQAEASRALDISTTLITSFMEKKRPREIIDIKLK